MKSKLYEMFSKNESENLNKVFSAVDVENNRKVANSLEVNKAKKEIGMFLKIKQKCDKSDNFNIAFNDFKSAGFDIKKMKQYDNLLFTYNYCISKKKEGNKDKTINSFIENFEFLTGNKFNNLMHHCMKNDKKSNEGLGFTAIVTVSIIIYIIQILAFLAFVALIIAGIVVIVKTISESVSNSRDKKTPKKDEKKLIEISNNLIKPTSMCITWVNRIKDPANFFNKINKIENDEKKKKKAFEELIQSSPQNNNPYTMSTEAFPLLTIVLVLGGLALVIPVLRWTVSFFINLKLDIRNWLTDNSEALQYNISDLENQLMYVKTDAEKRSIEKIIKKQKRSLETMEKIISDLSDKQKKAVIETIREEEEIEEEVDEIIERDTSGDDIDMSSSNDPEDPEKNTDVVFF